eukprot:scaffold29073_cov184-Amphora_coffeaeformis.AAC.4
MTVPGKCLCGAIQFTITPKELHAHACHCNMCRTWTGSAGSMTVACQEPPEFSQGKDLLTTFKSSEWGERCFCSKCGSSLFTNAPGFGYFGVGAGVLDNEDQSKLSLNEEIFIDKKPAYYCFQGDHPKLTEAEFLAKFSSPPEDK